MVDAFVKPMGQGTVNQNLLLWIAFCCWGFWKVRNRFLFEGGKDPNMPVHSSSSHWLPSLVGMVKCNVDASFSLPNRAEAIFLCKAVLWAISQCYDKVWFECDSLLVVQAVNGGDGGLVKIHSLSFDVQVLLERFSYSCLSHVRRHGNGVAHALAKLSWPHITSDVALTHIPADILDLAAKDCIC
ncbi:uncharacterized protein LOC132270421 [Cornus florida]|uniref:uncharacterized protein LOC132270421 n=1 Tax=Cornus florida TaxID=4283 RepID=UPI00289FBABD|nr:uncharacterized protein LOC132270421 [Cornus florida]